MEHLSIEDSQVVEVFQSRLYELKSREIKIENIFDSHIDLTVKFVYETQDSEDTFLLPFTTRLTKLSIAKGGYAMIPILFLPFAMKKYTCLLVLTDQKFGNIQYTLEGHVDLPTPIELPSPEVLYLENEITFMTKISTQNPLLHNARRMHVERLQPTQKSAEEQKVKALKEKEKVMESVTFDLESLNNEKISLPVSITIEKEGVSLPITLNFNVPVKDYPLRFLLKSQDGVDIRVYQFKVTIFPKPIKEVIEIRGSAKEALTKNIPFQNQTDRDWVIRAQFILDNNKNGSCFSGPKEIRIPRNSTQYYQILFKPHGVSEAEAKLLINNPFTGQQYEYDLKGYGEESNV